MQKIDISLKFIDPLFEAIGKLQMLHRILIFCGGVIAIIAASVYFLFMPKYEAMSSLAQEKSKLSSELITIKKKASELKKYEGLIKDAEKEFFIAKNKLPEQKDIPDLLADVSKAGHEAGLEFILFQPGIEKQVDFYAEIPVSIQVFGSYHNIALFFDNVSRLSRIVNIVNISLTPSQKGDELTNSCTAITYRFVEQPPPSANKKKK